MTFSRRDWLALMVGWTLGAVVGLGVTWYDVDLYAALAILPICTALATIAMLPRRPT